MKLCCAADLAVDALSLPLLCLSVTVDADAAVAAGGGLAVALPMLSFCTAGCCCWRSTLLMSRSGRDSRIGR